MSVQIPFMSNQGALRLMDDEAIIAEIASGTLMHQIATRYGVVKSAIRKRLKNHPDYPAAIQSQAEFMVDQATAELMEVGADQVLIARARARVDAAHKWAAARDPARWGPRQSDQTTLQVVIINPSQSEHGRLIDAENVDK